MPRASAAWPGYCCERSVELMPPAGPVAGLGCLVVHHLDARSSRSKIVGCQFKLVKGETWTATQHFEICLFERAWIGIDQAVHADHFVLERKQPITQMRPNEPGTSCHQYPHGHLQGPSIDARLENRIQSSED